MQELAEYIDKLGQFPLAILMLVYIYLNDKRMFKLIENAHKINEKLIDNIKTN